MLYRCGASVLGLLLAASCACAVRLHEIQLLGSHNSYHIAPKPELDAVREIDERLGELVDANKYSHPPLSEQLNDYQVRSIELDVYDDRQGGKFAFRGVRALLDLDGVWDRPPEMQEPGFKVMHIDNVDYETQCKTLVGCLSEIKGWSDSNPSHIPLVLRVEMKRQTVIEILEGDDPAAAGVVLEKLQELQLANPDYPTDLQRTDPPITTETATLLLDDIVTSIGREKLLVPDDLRGDAEYLRQALTSRGPAAFWPELDDVRGKVILILAGLGPQLIELYGPGLVGSPAFTRYLLEPNDDTDTLGIPGDIVFVEHYASGTSRYLAPLIAEGFFVLAHADLGGQQARVSDRTSYQEVVAAGPQVILTEHLRPFTQEAVRWEYSVRLPCEAGETYCVLPSNSTYVAQEEQVNLPDVPTRVEARDALLLRQSALAAAPAVMRVGGTLAGLTALMLVLW